MGTPGAAVGTLFEGRFRRFPGADVGAGRRTNHSKRVIRGATSPGSGAHSPGCGDSGRDLPPAATLADRSGPGSTHKSESDGDFTVVGRACRGRPSFNFPNLDRDHHQDDASHITLIVAAARLALAAVHYLRRSRRQLPGGDASHDTPPVAAQYPPEPLRHVNIMNDIPAS